MKRISILTFAAVLILAGTVYSQQPSAPQAAPQLTEVEHLRIENLQLKFQSLQAQMQQIQQEYQQVAAGIIKEHPGYVLDQQGNLAPEPKAAPKQAEKPAVPAKK